MDTQAKLPKTHEQMKTNNKVKNHLLPAINAKRMCVCVCLGIQSDPNSCWRNCCFCSWEISADMAMYQRNLKQSAIG